MDSLTGFDSISLLYITQGVGRSYLIEEKKLPYKIASVKEYGKRLNEWELDRHKPHTLQTFNLILNVCYIRRVMSDKLSIIYPPALKSNSSSKNTCDVI